MIPGLGFILSLLSIPAIVKLDEANTRYKANHPNNEVIETPIPKWAMGGKASNMKLQMEVFTCYVVDKIGSGEYPNAKYSYIKGKDGKVHFGNDITYKCDENGNITNEKTTAVERLHMARACFKKYWPQYRWVVIVPDWELLRYDDDFKATCRRNFTDEAVARDFDNQN